MLLLNLGGHHKLNLVGFYAISAGNGNSDLIRNVGWCLLNCQLELLNCLGQASSEAKK